MPRTIRTKVYTFDELNEPGKKNAIQWMRECHYTDNTALNLFEDACKEKAEEAGFTLLKLTYSLSYSQGDGLSFGGEIDRARFIREAIPGIKKSVFQVLDTYTRYEVNANNGCYSFASQRDVLFEIDTYKDYPQIEKLCEKVQDYIRARYLILCKQLEEMGYSWLEDADKDENLAEDIRANEYEFTADGKRFNQ